MSTNGVKRVYVPFEGFVHMKNFLEMAGTEVKCVKCAATDGCVCYMCGPTQDVNVLINNCALAMIDGNVRRLCRVHNFMEQLQAQGPQ